MRRAWRRPCDQIRERELALDDGSMLSPKMSRAAPGSLVRAARFRWEGTAGLRGPAFTHTWPAACGAARTRSAHPPAPRRTTRDGASSSGMPDTSPMTTVGPHVANGLQQIALPELTHAIQTHRSALASRSPQPAWTDRAETLARPGEPRRTPSTRAASHVDHVSPGESPARGQGATGAGGVEHPGATDRSNGPVRPST